MSFGGQVAVVDYLPRYHDHAIEHKDKAIKGGAKILIIWVMNFRTMILSINNWILNLIYVHIL